MYFLLRFAFFVCPIYDICFATTGASHTLGKRSCVRKSKASNEKQERGMRQRFDLSNSFIGAGVVGYTIFFLWVDRSQRRERRAGDGTCRLLNCVWFGSDLSERKKRSWREGGASCREEGDTYTAPPRALMVWLSTGGAGCGPAVTADSS